MPSHLTSAAAVTAACVAVHLVADRRGARGLAAAGKLAASAVFLAVALRVGVAGPFRTAIAVGLALSAVGDGLLLSRRRAAFLGGLGAFLLAHLAFAVAFAGAGRPSVLAGAVVLLASAAALAWIWPHAGGSMQLPVTAYCGAIGAMVTLALGVDGWDVRAAAVLFWLSDLAVARDRFVRPGPLNRVVGLPLYYAAQLLLASALP